MKIKEQAITDLSQLPQEEIKSLMIGVNLTAECYTACEMYLKSIVSEFKGKDKQELSICIKSLRGFKNRIYSMIGVKKIDDYFENLCEIQLILDKHVVDIKTKAYYCYILANHFHEGTGNILSYQNKVNYIHEQVELVDRLLAKFFDKHLKDSDKWLDKDVLVDKLLKMFN
jgi:hypothetical protein